MTRTASERSADVVLVVMPFAETSRPAIGVSLLQAAAKAAGHSSAIEYCNLDFADQVGRDLYAKVAAGPPQHLVGEWIFAEAAFGAAAPAGEEFVERVLAPHVPARLAQGVLDIRRRASGFADACARRVMRRRPRVVGFTSTFHQTCAALAVARRLKAHPDAPVVVFGGANCEGEMGRQLLASFEWVDFVATGEADAAFPTLLEMLLHGGPGPAPGILDRDDAGDEAAAEIVEDMDALPVPDFDDFFEQSEHRGHLVVETSRGCWWGAKHHCTFCGLNGNTMRFRAKSPPRAFDEITFLSRRHGVQMIESVDNILDPRYLDSLFPMLVESGLDLRFFYEVKANIRHDRLCKMREVGIVAIQPGIESLSSKVLRLMDKGVTALRNIQVMRWCEEVGISYVWNILAGFPGEEPSEYERMSALVPQLVHLEPPMSVARLRLDRFSPFHTHAARHGFANVRAALAYACVFPLAPEELDRLAYYFDYDYADGRVPATYLAPLVAAVADWTGARDTLRPRLDADVTADGGAVDIHDTRPVAVTPVHRLEGLPAEILQACDAATTIPGLLRNVACDERAARDAIDELIARRLLVADDGRYLSLPVFRARPEPQRGHVQPLTGVTAR